MTEPSYVFLVSGWGLGHATRTWAIIQQILEADNQSKIIVFSWGVGYRFFTSKSSQINFELYALTSYIDDSAVYGLKFAKKVRFAFRSVKIWIKNSIYIHQLLKNKKNLICIVDSDYHFFSYYFKKTFLASISQTPFIIHHWRRNFFKFSVLMNIRFAFFEWFDYLLQKLFCDVIFSPSFHILPDYDGRIKFIPPIVRTEFLISPSQTIIQPIGVIGSGSVFSEEIKQKTRNLNYVYEEKNEFGLGASGVPVIDTFGSLITQCGFSSLSECYARNKKMFLVPIDNHPEQLINAYVLIAMKKGSLYWEHKTSEGLFQQTLKVATWDQCNGAAVFVNSLKMSSSKI